MRSSPNYLWSTLRSTGLVLLLGSLFLGGLGNSAFSLLLPQAIRAASPLTPLSSTEEEEQKEKEENKERESADDEVWNRSRATLRQSRLRVGDWISKVALPLRRSGNPDRLLFASDFLPLGSGVNLRC